MMDSFTYFGLTRKVKPKNRIDWWTGGFSSPEKKRLSKDNEENGVARGEDRG